MSKTKVYWFLLATALAGNKQCVVGIAGLPCLCVLGDEKIRGVAMIGGLVGPELVLLGAIYMRWRRGEVVSTACIRQEN